MFPMMMNKGLMKRMKASEKNIVVAISPDIQGSGAYTDLDKEQKSVLKYAIMDYAKRHNMNVSLFNCLKGTGEICWGFEAKTTRNRKPAVRVGVRKKVAV